MGQCAVVGCLLFGVLSVFPGCAKEEVALRSVEAPRARPEVRAVGLLDDELESMDEGATQSALFELPNVSRRAVQQLLGAIGDDEGVRSARVDLERGHLVVTFEPSRTSAKALLKALSAVEPGVGLASLHRTTSDSAHIHDTCGECPKHSACGSQ